MPTFCQKNVNSLKNTVLSCHFFQNFHEKPPVVMRILGKKDVNFDKTTKYYGPKKSIGCAIFFKNVNSQNKTLPSYAYFVQKTCLLSKTQCFHVICFNFSMKNSILSCPNLVKK